MLTPGTILDLQDLELTRRRLRREDDGQWLKE